MWALIAFSLVAFHGAPTATQVPHWLVLLVAVPSLWLLASGMVVVLDRLLGRYVD